MKKVLFILALSFGAYAANASGVCDPTDLVNYDAIDCAAGTGSSQPGNPNATAIPVDGGASLLLLGGVAYGTKRLKAIRAKKAARS